MLPDQKFFFINKTADSKILSRSEGAELSRIFSHVQPESHAPPRHEGTRVLSLSEPVDNRSIDSSDAVSTSEDLRTGTFSRSKLGSGKIVTRAKTTRAKLPVLPSQIPSPRHSLSNTSFDLFLSTVIPVNQYIGSLLGFCESVLRSSFASMLIRR